VGSTEHTINDAIAEVLRGTRHAWRAPKTVFSEHTGMLKGGNKRADILILERNVSPVVIETEVLPAVTVEREARGRLGEIVRTTGRPILSSLAVRLPARLRTKSGVPLKQELETADDLEIAMFTGSTPKDAVRWPLEGWIKGSVADLSILTQSASVPPAVIERASQELTAGVNEAAGLLEELVKTRPATIKEISNELRQGDNGKEQIQRVVATIFANAFIFQESLSRGEGELASVHSLGDLRSNGLTKFAIIDEWEKILRINYYPIFDIASRILQRLPSQNIKAFIASLIDTADKLASQGVMRSHDLTGKVFQRVITDRKFLAANYTDPASAALLTGLAITSKSSFRSQTWASAGDVKSLRVADFACGTGTLLSTAYQRIGQLHELSGGNAAILHAEMIADSLIGADVLPAATHLTATMLSGAHPAVKYTHSSIMTIPFGRKPYGIALGSLDLLKDQRDFTDTVKVIEGMGQRERETWLALPHTEFDIVMMNPPFTRNTDHKRKNKNGISHPMFAAFGSTPKDQKDMATATKKLIKQMGANSAHGNAGEASIFLVLGDRKLKEGGVLAVVMPFSLMLGDSWDDSRALLSNNYSDLILVSIAGTRDKDMSFSADTDMRECLVVGRKAKTGSKRATFVVLKKRPMYSIEGANAAQQIHRLIAEKKLHNLEDGPVGGTPLYFGADLLGHVIEAPLPKSGGWNVARIDDLSLAQAAYQLANERRIWLPRMRKSEAVHLPITTVSRIGKIGPYDLDISGDTSTGEVRGPFDIEELKDAKKAPTYPALWSHDADRERTMSFEADCEASPRHGKNAVERSIIADKVANIWGTASHCHFNRDFRFNSQSTGMQFTRRKTIGGRAWLSISLSSVEQEKALVLWANTSLGMLLYWWHSNKQQAGRGSIPKSSLQTLPVLDVTALTPRQLSAAAELFDATSGRDLLPFNEIDRDSVRLELDRRVAQEVLGFPRSMLEAEGPLQALREKLAQEPSIRGSKESKESKVVKKPVASEKDLPSKQVVVGLTSIPHHGAAGVGAGI
jgi:hypothetical protein